MGARSLYRKLKSKKGQPAFSPSKLNALLGAKQEIDMKNVVHCQTSDALKAWKKLPHDIKNATSMAVFITWHENLDIDMTERCDRVAAAVLIANKEITGG